VKSTQQDVKSTPSVVQVHARRAEPEMIQAEPEMTQVASSSNAVPPPGYHMSKVCDEHGCLTQAVPDNQAEPQSSVADGTSNSMAAVDAAFNKWRTDKGISQTLASDPPPTVMPGEPLSRKELEELEAM